MQGKWKYLQLHKANNLKLNYQSIYYEESADLNQRLLKPPKKL